jgi:hypothetical protein
VVMEIVEAVNFPAFHPSLLFVECAASVSVGDKYQGGIFSKPDTTPSKEQINRTAIASLGDIDARSIRAMREWIAAQPSAPQHIKDYESQAIAERGKIKP